MAWIKRNIVFVIISVAAIAALGFAGYYNFTRWQANNQAAAKLTSKYTELDRLYNLKPNPGNGSVDNIKAARDEQQQILDLLAKENARFAPIAPIPTSTNVTSEDFASALRQTVDQMQRDAANASVILPPKYNFSFEAQRQLMIFDQTTLPALAAQLGEVKAICDIINSAKVNSLDAIRRERVSADDANGPQNDYTTLTSTSTDLAVLTPYEVTFECFTPELASVLSGFASSPLGIIVKGFNVEPVGQIAQTQTGSEYGGRGGMYPPGQGYPQAAPVGRAGVGGLETVIDEKQLRITMQVLVVKMRPVK